MPYIKIKAYPKDAETKKRVAERINEVFLQEWGCPAEAISLCFEEVSPSDWEAAVKVPEIDANADKMTILHGKKKY